MGKHKINSGVYVQEHSSPSEEKIKIKNSILALFKRHFQVEENAVSVGKLAGGDNSRPKVPGYCSDDSKLSMDNQNDLICRKRRRKTKAERNKTRSKSASSQNSIEEKADINRHLKTAHSVSYPLRSKGQQKEDCHNAITHNRLTKRLGLFNKSKKSSTALRGPIVLTESVRKETEEDLKKILNVTDKGSEVAMEIDADSADKTSGHVQPLSQHIPAVLYEPQLRNKVTPTSFVKTKYSQNLSSTSTGISTCPSSIELDEFPKDPPMEEIIQQLAEKLEDHNIFKGIDLARDLCDDLNKLMKHNGPRDTTPASTKIRSNISASGGGSVCRSLLNSFTPCVQEKSKGTERPISASATAHMSQERPQILHTETRESHKQISASNMHQFTNTQILSGLSSQSVSSIKDLAVIAHIENIASRVRQNFKTSDAVEPPVGMNAIDLLKHNDNMCLKREISCTVSNPSTARSNLLTFPRNDHYFESGNLQEMGNLSQSNKENTSQMQIDSLSNRSFSSQDRLSNSQSSGFHSHHSLSELSIRPSLEQILCRSDMIQGHKQSPCLTLGRPSDGPVDNRNQGPEMFQAVVTEYHEDTQYMPKFHGDFYKDSLWFEKTILSNIDQVPEPSLNTSARENEPSSMDILDFLDQSSQDVVSRHDRNSSPKWQRSSDTSVLTPQPLSPDSPQLLPRRLY